MPIGRCETRLRDFAIIVGLASAIQRNRMIFTIIVGLASDIERSISIGIEKLAGDRSFPV